MSSADPLTTTVEVQVPFAQYRPKNYGPRGQEPGKTPGETEGDPATGYIGKWKGVWEKLIGKAWKGAAETTNLLNNPLEAIDEATDDDKIRNPKAYVILVKPDDDSDYQEPADSEWMWSMTPSLVVLHIPKQPTNWATLLPEAKKSLLDQYMSIGMAYPLIPTKTNNNEHVANPSCTGTSVAPPPRRGGPGSPPTLTVAITIQVRSTDIGPLKFRPNVQAISSSSWLENLDRALSLGWPDWLPSEEDVRAQIPAHFVLFRTWLHAWSRAVWRVWEDPTLEGQLIRDPRAFFVQQDPILADLDKSVTIAVRADPGAGYDGAGEWELSRTLVVLHLPNPPPANQEVALEHYISTGMSNPFTPAS